MQAGDLRFRPAPYAWLACRSAACRYGHEISSFFVGDEKRETEMTTLRNSVARGFFGWAFAVLSAANAAAAAVQGHRRPKDRDLRTLGINPADFPRI